MLKKNTLIPFLLLVSVSFGQKLKKADKAIIQSLRSHIEYLASDKLEGRRAGTAGEAMAAEYIIKQFQLTGLHPKGDSNGWQQAFDINDGKEIKTPSYFFINGSELKLNKDFFPLAFSADGSLAAMAAIALRERATGRLGSLKDRRDETCGNPHCHLLAKIQQYATESAAKGATSL